MSDIITYGEHPLQKIKVYSFSTSIRYAVLFIHGGAWTDPRNTYDDFHDVINRIKKKISSVVNIFGINYRLSPEVKHPFHLFDVVQAISLLANYYHVEELLFVGHSVGATLMLQLLNPKAVLNVGFQILRSTKSLLDTDFPEAGQVSSVLEYYERIKFRALFFLDGIYDVQDLVREYPAYESFVYKSFVSDLHIREGTPLSSLKTYRPFERISLSYDHFVIVHSLEDELLSLRQTLALQKFLADKKQPFTLFVGNYGTHEEVYKNEYIGTIILRILTK